MPFALNTGDMMQSLKKALLGVQKNLGGTSLPIDYYLAKLAASDPFPAKSFTIGEKSAALLLLLVRVNMVEEEIVQVADECYEEDIAEVASNLKDIIYCMLKDNVAFQLALEKNIRKDEIEI